MGLFDKMREPVFLKESSSAKEQLEELKQLKNSIPDKYKAEIERDIRLLSAGIAGEENIAFELKNSHMPLFVIHDLYLEYEGLSAQIDYLIITRKRIFVIECKNLVGNIEINNNGDFIRVFENNKKEGLYSPITQNQRHLELIKQIKANSKSNFILKAMFEKFFYDTYRSAVVLANPKTILNDRYAKKEIKNQVIRADQLISFIKEKNAEPGIDTASEESTEKAAYKFLALHKDNPKDYVEKYRKQIEKREFKPEDTEKNILCPKCGAPMVKRTAVKGPNAGKTFYGCSKYPKCRGIVNIQD